MEHSLKHYEFFDLDGTVICSLHRQNTLPDGSLDLARWIENNTPEKIMQDKLLPLANFWKRIQKMRNIKIVVCTARVIGEADIEFLKSHGLNCCEILSRPMGCNLPDWELKRNLLLGFFASRKIPASQWKRFNFYDDNLSVLKMVDSLGLNAYNSISLNKRVA